jgi:hypothetical protein
MLSVRAMSNNLGDAHPCKEHMVSLGDLALDSH